MKANATVKSIQASVRDANCAKLAFTILMTAYGVICALNPSDFHFLDRVNLIAHEAGHLLLGWFGEFIMVLGGTFGQISVPAAFIGYFYLKRDLFASFVALFWFGQNYIGISIYARDAQTMKLPLVSIGGGDAIHDWNYILMKLDLLRWDQAVGNTLYAIGAISMAAAVIGSFYCSFQNEETIGKEKTTF